MVTHFVLFRLTDSADIDEALVRLRGMSGRIPSLRSVRAGRDANRGPSAYDLVLVTEHDSAEDLAAYVDHPAHKEVAGWLRPRIASRAVVDTLDLG